MLTVYPNMLKNKKCIIVILMKALKKIMFATICNIIWTYQFRMIQQKCMFHRLSNGYPRLNLKLAKKPR